MIFDCFDELAMNKPESIIAGNDSFVKENVTCNIHIGSRSGQVIENSIRDAAKSIKIISPYLSKDTMELIGAKHREGVFDIKIITNDHELLYHKEALKKIIGKNSATDGGNEYISYFCKVAFYGDEILHSKIYIIDNKKAFLGSANFTAYGFHVNHEVVIQINSIDVIEELSAYFEKLFSGMIPIMSMNDLGKLLYQKKQNNSQEALS